MKTRTKKPSTSRSLSVTLAIAFLALSAVVLILSSGLQLFSSVATQQEAAAGKLQLLAQEASQPVSSFIQDKFSILETANQLTDPAQMTPDGQQQVLDSVLGRDPAFRQVAVLNTQGQEIGKASRLSQQATSNLAEQIPAEALAGIKQGQRYISPVYVDPLTSEPLVLMAIPAANALGDFQGILAAEVNLKFMWDLMDQLNVGETGAAYVVDKQGNLLAFNDTARVLRGENVANLDEVREYITGVSTVPFLDLTNGIQGVPVVGAYAPLGASDWAVVTEMPWNEAYREVIRNGLASGVILVVMAFLAGLLGVYVARRLTVPLVSLTGTASQIGAGDLELQASVSGPREVAQLATSFNTMTLRLRDTIDSLETRVEMRTAQVQASADVGRVVTSILDPDQLLKQVVQLITERFGFYYAAAFTLDAAGQWAVLREASGPGDAAWLLKQAGHRLEITGNSMVGACIRERHARIALDVGTEAIRFSNPLLPETHSEVALPLIVGDQILGALDVQSAQAAAFDETSTAVLQNMADQIAVALNNAAQYKLEQRRARQTTQLLEASVELSTLTETTSLDNRIVEVAANLLHADSAALWQPAEERTLELVYATGALKARIGQRVPVGEGIAGRVYATSLALRLNNLRTWQDATLDFSEIPVQAVVAVPMVWQGETVGVLVAAHTHPDSTFSADDGNTAQLFANQTASMLANLRLLAQIQNTLADLGAANRRLTREVWQARLHGSEITYEYRRSANAGPEPPALALTLPIELRGQAIGQLILEDDQPQRELTDDERSIVQEIAQRMSLALESARLFEQTQAALGEARRLAQREQMVNRITGQLRAATTVDEVLQIATAEMRRAVHASWAAAELKPPAGSGNGRGDDHDSQ
jgi:GAF domain-containing protein/HAMP domain-containing protein